MWRFNGHDQESSKVKQIRILKGTCSAQWWTHCSGCPHPTQGAWVWVPALLQNQLPANAHAERQQVMVQVLGSLATLLQFHTPSFSLALCWPIWGTWRRKQQMGEWNSLSKKPRTLKRILRQGNTFRWSHPVTRRGLSPSSTLPTGEHCPLCWVSSQKASGKCFSWLKQDEKSWQITQNKTFQRWTD